jgi:hypothetical protein
MGALQVISGGQTGVDRAALDVALNLGLPCGGWCPRGRKAEDGRIPDRYPLRETSSTSYLERTRRNIADADGTLIVVRGGIVSRGTRATADIAARARRPTFVVDLERPAKVDEVRRWIAENAIVVLNVAGPRESQAPGIHALASDYLRRLLST